MNTTLSCTRWFLCESIVFVRTPLPIIQAPPPSPQVYYLKKYDSVEVWMLLVGALITIFMLVLMLCKMHVYANCCMTRVCDQPSTTFSNHNGRAEGIVALV